MAGITFSRFSKDQERGAKWIVAINRQDWTPSGSEVHIYTGECQTMMGIYQYLLMYIGNYS